MTGGRHQSTCFAASRFEPRAGTLEDASTVARTQELAARFTPPSHQTIRWDFGTSSWPS